eukprot:1191443-Prorocentrum_minimum.AAC.2
MNKNVSVADVQDEVVMLTGLHPDTKLGTYVHFSGGARGILLWRREPLTFCVVLEEAPVEKGEKVTCDPNERAGVLVNEVRISHNDASHMQPYNINGSTSLPWLVTRSTSLDQTPPGL